MLIKSGSMIGGPRKVVSAHLSYHDHREEPVSPTGVLGLDA